MTKLTEKELKLVSEAVTKAEKNTTGELAVVVAKQSSEYAIYELTFGVIVGLIFTVLSLIFYSSLDNFIMNLFWSNASYITPSVIGLGNFVIIAIFYFLANLSFIDRLIVPNSIKDLKVKEKASQSFIEYGVSNTKDRTGVLIFISYLERRVIILADKGISDIHPHDSWQKQVDNIIHGIKTNNFAPELIKVITEIGETLAKNFPTYENNPNELSNEVREL